MDFVNQLKKSMGMKAKVKREDDEEIEPGELKSSGIEIQKGDSRLKGGIRYSNLSEDEKARLRAMRRSRNGS